jgi:hypothetical protein
VGGSGFQPQLSLLVYPSQSRLEATATIKIAKSDIFGILFHGSKEVSLSIDSMAYFGCDPRFGEVYCNHGIFAIGISA